MDVTGIGNIEAEVGADLPVSLRDLNSPCVSLLERAHREPVAGKTGCMHRFPNSKFLSVALRLDFLRVRRFDGLLRDGCPFALTAHAPDEKQTAYHCNREEAGPGATGKIRRKNRFVHHWITRIPYSSANISLLHEFTS